MAKRLHPSNPFHLEQENEWRWAETLASVQADSLEMPLSVPQRSGRCLLLHREMGSERPPRLFPLNHAECILYTGTIKEEIRCLCQAKQLEKQVYSLGFVSLFFVGRGQIFPEMWSHYMPSWWDVNRWWLQVCLRETQCWRSHRAQTPRPVQLCSTPLPKRVFPNHVPGIRLQHLAAALS